MKLNDCLGDFWETEPLTTINSPPRNEVPHYTSGGIETIDYIKAKFTPEQYLGFCFGNVLKYVSRAGKKGSVLPDLVKARDYLNWAIEVLEEGTIEG